MKMNRFVLLTICLMGGISPCSANPILDFQSLATTTAEGAAQSAVGGMQDAFTKMLEEQLKKVGEVGQTFFDPKKLFSMDSNPLVEGIETVDISIPSLGLTGDESKNTAQTKSTLEGNVILPMGKDGSNLTSQERDKIKKHQDAMIKELSSQGFAKANVDKYEAMNVKDKDDAAKEMINAVKTERESQAAYAHVEAAFATQISDVVDKASANLVLTSANHLREIENITSTSDDSSKETTGEGA